MIYNPHKKSLYKTNTKKSSSDDGWTVIDETAYQDSKNLSKVKKCVKCTFSSQELLQHLPKRLKKS